MTLYVIGTGPGDISYMSQRAIDIIKEVDCIAGYTTYINLIKDLVAGKEIISTGMTKEVQRVEKAIEIALTGKSCALISGGDPGIYAMAGLVFEICQQRDIKLLRHGNGQENQDLNTEYPYVCYIHRLCNENVHTRLNSHGN